MSSRVPINRFTRLLILLSWCGTIPALGAKLPQTISWRSLLRPHLILKRPYPLEVTASSGLPVTFEAVLVEGFRFDAASGRTEGFSKHAHPR